MTAGFADMIKLSEHDHIRLARQWSPIFQMNLQSEQR